MTALTAPSRALPPLLAAETSASLVNAVHLADCLELCERVYRAGVRVDMILADLPYGTTACAWDTVIPFEPMWAAFKRIIKPRGAIVLTASQPFTSVLICSNLADYKYSWVWVKNKITGFANAKLQPLRRFEDVCVFNSGLYYPQGIKRVNIVRKNGVSAGGSSLRGTLKGEAGKGSLRTFGSVYQQSFTDYPDNVLPIDCEPITQHGTQKPVDLFRYLIRTYTLPNQLVFDPCVGSGTTAVAAREEGRRYIVGDSSPEYVGVTNRRLDAPYTPSFMPALEAVG